MTDQPPGTRHCHGADWHDHPGGDRGVNMSGCPDRDRLVALRRTAKDYDYR
jgi:hypothetical protein